MPIRVASSFTEGSLHAVIATTGQTARIFTALLIMSFLSDSRQACYVASIRLVN